MREMQLETVFLSLEPGVDIVPLTNILVDVIPMGLEGAVVLRCKVVPKMVGQGG